MYIAAEPMPGCPPPTGHPVTVRSGRSLQARNRTAG